VLVNLVDVVVWADCTAICVAVHGWEEESALSLPVFSSDEARSEGRSVSGSSVLPVVKRLIAKHPVPLSISSIADSSVREIQIRCVVCVKAFQCRCVVIPELCTPCKFVVSPLINSLAGRNLQPTTKPLVQFA